MFNAKIAIFIDPALETRQKLNVTAFPASGIAGAAPEAMGKHYEDVANRAAFREELAESPDLVGPALRVPKKDVAKTIKGAKLHP